MDHSVTCEYAPLSSAIKTNLQSPTWTPISLRCCSVAQSCLTLRTHGLQRATFPCLSLSPRVYSDSCPLSLWCHPTISSSITPFFSCPQSFLAPPRRHFPGGAVIKNPSANAGNTKDMDSITVLGRSPGGENDNQLQYSCLGNPMDRGAWQAIVLGVAKSWHTWAHIQGAWFVSWFSYKGHNKIKGDTKAERLRDINCLWANWHGIS